VRVGAVADEVGAVDAGAFGDEEIGAGLGVRKDGQQRDDEKGLKVSHGVIVVFLMA
jgi:hypothetical protein